MSQTQEQFQNINFSKNEEIIKNNFGPLTFKRNKCWVSHFSTFFFCCFSKRAENYKIK